MVRGLSHPPIVWVTQYEVATLIAGVVNAAVEAKRVPLVSASYHLKVAPGFPLAVTVAVDPLHTDVPAHEGAVHQYVKDLQQQTDVPAHEGAVGPVIVIVTDFVVVQPPSSFTVSVIFSAVEDVAVAVAELVVAPV